MKRLPLIILIVVSLLASCQANLDASPADTLTQAVQPSPSPEEITPPTPSPDITVCASGCDFALIQKAVDAESTQAGAVIGVLDHVHTEAGIVVGKSVTIQGNGPHSTIVQAHSTPGEGENRVFEISPEATVILRGLTIQNGNPTTSPLTGGGVLNYGTLTLENAIIRDNFGSSGGGVYNEGTLTMVNSAITENGSVGGGDAYLECETGGGLKVITGTATLINSTISNNRAKSKGGGVHVACEGKLILENSTISTNFATESGGGVYLNGSGDFTNSTITENSASNVGGIALNGKDDVHEYGHLRLINTIIANNTARIGDYGIQDCSMEGYAVIPETAFSWIGDGNCEPAFSGDPMLGSLENNGGPTLTHSLLPGSPAIDIIPIESCTADTDQRGEPRDSLCDIGAFEMQTP